MIVLAVRLDSKRSSLSHNFERKGAKGKLLIFFYQEKGILHVFELDLNRQRAMEPNTLLAHH